jgi:hypothetical protein
LLYWNADIVYAINVNIILGFTQTTFALSVVMITIGPVLREEFEEVDGFLLNDNFGL